MTVPADARPGDIVLVRRGPRERLTDLTADAICWGTQSEFYHAALYMGAKVGLIEAERKGVTYAPADKYGNRAEWFTESRMPANLRPADGQRMMACLTAKSLWGTPYGWPDILAITLAQRRLHNIVDARKALNDQPWWVQRLVDRETVICSQLVALAYLHAGIVLVPDRLVPGLVSPGDLGRVLLVAA